MAADAEARTTLAALLAEARESLAAAGIDGAALDARLLVEHFTGTTRTDAIASPGMAVAAPAAAATRAAIARRARHEPVHRILGRRAFFGLDLLLSAETLEPRPDTEALVELCLPVVRRTAAAKRRCRILDLGTGTGALALALLSQEARAEAVGTDISAAALETAGLNAKIHGLEARFTTQRSTWFEAVGGRFDVIVSNPPYIRSSDIAALDPEVRLFDPPAALDGGADGLDAYRAIAAGAPDRLFRDGRVALEIGAGQGGAVKALFAAAGFRLAATGHDLAGHERALMFMLAS